MYTIHSGESREFRNCLDQIIISYQSKYLFDHGNDSNDINTIIE